MFIVQSTRSDRCSYSSASSVNMRAIRIESSQPLTNNHRQISYFLLRVVVVFSFLSLCAAFVDVVAHLAWQETAFTAALCTPVSIIVSKVEILLLMRSCIQSSITMLRPHTIHTILVSFIAVAAAALPYNACHATTQNGCEQKPIVCNHKNFDDQQKRAGGPSRAGRS